VEVTSVRIRRHGGLLVVVGNLALAGSLSGQAELQGHVYVSPGRPIANAEIALPRAGLRVLTDSLGRFRLTGVPRGTELVTVRAVGFRPESLNVMFKADEAVIRDVMLRVAVNELPTVAVHDTSRPVARSKMADFEQRRAGGIGRFISRDLLDKNENQRLGEIVAANVPGVLLRRGVTGPEAWATSARTPNNSKCGLCGGADMLDRVDLLAGAKPACYLDVYVNGVIEYDSARRMPLFNLNSFQPSAVEGIEVYTGAGQIPTQYNRTGGACGVMLIWTREPR
jgi:hypothetical protein